MGPYTYDDTSRNNFVDYVEHLCYTELVVIPKA